MAEFKLDISRKPSASTASRKGCPAVSVVIPLYNTEKYIGECLNTLLAQTFTDFEIVVVDDCSTDNSVAVVENYMPQFGGRLTLLHMEENSGGGALPRNKGLNFSRGEYIFFVDSDDFLTTTALAELYTLAKEYDADVVHCEKNFEADDDGGNIRLVTHQSGELVENPTLETEVLERRVNDMLERDIWGAPWCKLVRRDFLLENDLFFQNVRPCQDYLWTLTLLFFAEKFLRVPNAVYCWRQTDKSTIRGNAEEDKFNLWLNPVILGLKGLDKTMGKLEFFRNNPQFRYAVLDFVVKKMFVMSFEAGMTVPQFGIYGKIKDKFGGKLGEFDILIPALCTAINTQQKIIIMNQQNLNKLVAETDKRIAELENELSRLA